MENESSEEALVILNDVASEGQGLSVKSPPSDKPGSPNRVLKRRAMPKWREKVKVSSADASGIPLGDGYSWRKYGKNVVLGSRYPRSYYRCRVQQNCLAKKQVQRTDDDPCVFAITYIRKHTCISPGSATPMKLQEKQE